MRTVTVRCGVPRRRRSTRIPAASSETSAIRSVRVTVPCDGVGPLRAVTLRRVAATITELDLGSAAWLEFVRSRPEALPFHHPSWAMFLAECYGFRPFALVLDGGSDGGPAAGLPVLETRARLRGTRWISLPFTDVCPPLVEEHDAGRFTAALEGARRDAGVDALEVRAPIAGARATHPLALRHTLRLGRVEQEVAGRFRPAIRRNIRAAERNALTLRRAEREADLETTFYRLQVQTRRRHGLPVQPRRFFRLLWRRILEPGLGFGLFVCSNGTPVAAAVFLTWERTITYKYGASDAAFWRLRPNNLLFREAISWGCDHGYQTFDFGRTDFEGMGLRRFKLGWGCQEEDLRYTVLGRGAARSHGLARSVGQPILRRSPPWVLRVLGNLLYRQTA